MYGTRPEAVAMPSYAIAPEDPTHLVSQVFHYWQVRVPGRPLSAIVCFGGRVHTQSI